MTQRTPGGRGVPGTYRATARSIIFMKLESRYSAKRFKSYVRSLVCALSANMDEITGHVPTLEIAFFR